MILNQPDVATNWSEQISDANSQIRSNKDEGNQVESWWDFISTQNILKEPESVVKFNILRR